MESTIKYNRFEIDDNLSMGENGFLYYNDFMENNAYNRIILSSILNLHKKRYVEIETNEKNELIIKIITGTQNLKISEYFIYECLKQIDKDENGTITLNEFNTSENTIFAKNKKNIKELIYQEALDDDLIDKEKYSMKRTYFFRILSILCILAPMAYLYKFVLIILGVLLLILIDFKMSKPKDELNKLKESLINSDIMKYGSKNELKKIIIEFIICFIIFFANYYILNYLNLLVPNTLLLIAIETIIILIYAIKNYIKFIKIDILSDKAISTQQNLQSLANFLKDYSLIENRKSIEIHLWDIYLILSVLLNINKTITKELKFEISDNHKNKEIEKQFDFYENKYFYINDKNEKVYLD